MSCFWKLYYSAHMILRNLKYTQSIVMTFLPKVLEFVISIFKSFCRYECFYEISHYFLWNFSKILLMALDSNWIFFQLPLNVFWIDNFELIIYFRFIGFLIPVQATHLVCKNFWAYSMEGT